MYFNFVVLPLLLFLTGILIVWLCIRRMLSLSKKSSPKWWKVAQRSILSVAVLLAATVSLSSAYNAIAMHIFWSAHPAPGSLYQVHGHAMHLYCTGSGSPTIVLEAGWGISTPVLGWANTQPDLARFTRVCSYDRPGLGWSEPQPGPGDADHIAADLHELLAQAGVGGPIVLMAHSLGGVDVRDYTAHYPDEVAGLILLDSSTPYQQQRSDALVGRQTNTHLDLFIRLYGLFSSTGLPRLLGMCKPYPGLEGLAARELGEGQCRPHIDALLHEYYSFDASSEETVHTGPFGNLPILIISRDPATGGGPKEPAELRQFEVLWNQMQEDLKQLSTRSLRIVAKGSGHEVHFDRKALVLSHVQLFIAQIRGAAPPPAHYGSTVIE